ncbi:MAG: HAMP domain-containing protein [Cyanobacteria bacterium J083]|nr:MAG: HAMP domain-containing protein [Cyanobacteria bacterium J083]
MNNSENLNEQEISVSAEIETKETKPQVSSELNYPKAISWQNRWQNLNFRTKLITGFIVSMSLPVIAVTQSLITVSQGRLLQSLEENLNLGLNALAQNIQQENQTIINKTKELATDITNSGIGQLNQQVAGKLEKILSSKIDQNNLSSFYLITDAQGKTIAQKVYLADEDFKAYSLLPQSKKETKTKFKAINLPPGIKLGDIPIIANSLQNKKALSGMELWQSQYLKRLGLAEQANIGLREQKIKGLSPEKQPTAQIPAAIDNGQAGLILTAIEPIQAQGKVIGSVIVGTLINRNYEIVDNLKQNIGVDTATIFAQDWRVSTNVPYTDKKTRAIGTRVSRVVAETVLNKQQTYLGKANIIGEKYLTAYKPLYDHQKILNPQAAQPTGIAYVGESYAIIGKTLNRLLLVGYGIGILILGSSIFLIIPIANSLVKPLENILDFVQKRRQGENKISFIVDERQDEIGLLAKEINQMVESIDETIQTAELAREQAENLAAEQAQQNATLQKELFQFLTDVEEASNGDLTVRAEITADEIGIVADFFNSIVENLRDIVIQVKTAAGQVNLSIDDNENAIRELAESAIAQTDKINEALHSVELMTQSIEEVATSASTAAEVARSASTTAEKGEQAVERSVESILQLRSTVAETAKKVKRLGESSQQISKVVALINQIAMQTNLLAINASIEAARAGEEGRGFAVVAEEVGELAAQSAAATQEIEQIVENIQLETAEVVEAMELGTAQVVEGTKLVEETKNSLSDILKVSRQIDELVQSISTATVSQADTSNSVSQLMDTVAQISEQTSNSAGQISTSLQEAVTIAQKLKASVGTFKVGE